MGCTPYASFFLFLGQAHSFLLPPSTLRQTHPPGYAFTPRQKNLQSPPSHMCFRFWTVTRQMKRIKSRHKSKSQESFLKLSCFYLPPKKLIKKQTADRLCMKFPWTPISPPPSALSPILLPLLFQRIFQPGNQDQQNGKRSHHQLPY